MICLKFDLFSLFQNSNLQIMTQPSIWFENTLVKIHKSTRLLLFSNLTILNVLKLAKLFQNSLTISHYQKVIPVPSVQNICLLINLQLCCDLSQRFISLKFQALLYVSYWIIWFNFYLEHEVTVLSIKTHQNEVSFCVVTCKWGFAHSHSRQHLVLLDLMVLNADWPEIFTKNLLDFIEICLVKWFCVA